MDTKSMILVPTLAGLMLVGGAAAGYTGLVAAQDSTNSGTAQTGIMGMFRGERAPHVDGTITAINGSVITITADDNHGGGSYTIDTSGATFKKAGADASLGSFAVGDKVWAVGSFNGTHLTAKVVSDAPGFGKGPGGHGMGGRHGKNAGVMGTVSAINGSTITVTGMDGQSYSVDAASAKVQRMVEGSLSDIAVGDRIGAHGTVSGTTVTATNIMDDVPERPVQ